MSGGYRDDDAPWSVRGRALYQLNLVKASDARKHVPADLKLVELFGYTLGGVYLARYDDSPAGVFDEMVALGGLVWNPPTSCAWAARVFVNNRDARARRQDVRSPLRLRRLRRGARGRRDPRLVERHKTTVTRRAHHVLRARRVATAWKGRTPPASHQRDP